MAYCKQQKDKTTDRRPVYILNCYTGEAGFHLLKVPISKYFNER